MYYACFRLNAVHCIVLSGVPVYEPIRLLVPSGVSPGGPTYELIWLLVAPFTAERRRDCIYASLYSSFQHNKRCAYRSFSTSTANIKKSKRNV